MCGRVLITGASGFLGRFTVPEFHRRGYFVRGVLRSDMVARGWQRYVEAYVVGDINGSTDWSAAMKGVDTVVHLAARVHVMREHVADPLEAFRRVNVDGTLCLARASAESGVRRFVFVSSIKVNGNSTTTTPFSEQSVPAPTDPYAISKWEAERLLLEFASESGLQVTIIRPPLMYGPGVQANFRRLLDAVGRGVPFPFGAVRNRRSLLYVGNLADALVRCVEHERAAGQTFLVSDGALVSSAELVRAIGQAIGREARVLPVPPGLLAMGGRLMGKGAEVQRLLGSLAVDSSRIRAELGWTPPFTMDEGLALTAEWWRASGKN